MTNEVQAVYEVWRANSRSYQFPVMGNIPTLEQAKRVAEALSAAPSGSGQGYYIREAR